MEKILFKKTIVKASSPLIDLGYTLAHGDLSRKYDGAFYKMLQVDVECTIGFQLFRFYIPGTREFTVWLTRLRMPNFPKEKLEYRGLIATVPGLLIGPYGKNTLHIRESEWGFSKYLKWEFDSNASLLAQVIGAIGLTTKYGIAWLEDPLSIMQ